MNDGSGKCAYCGAAMTTGGNTQGTGTGTTQKTDTQGGTTQKTEETVKPTEKPVDPVKGEDVVTPEVKTVTTTGPDPDIDPTASVMSEGNVWLVAAIGGAALAAAAVSVFLVKKKRAVR